MRAKTAVIVTWTLVTAAFGALGYGAPAADHPLLRAIALLGFWVLLGIAVLFLLWWGIWGRRTREEPLPDEDPTRTIHKTKIGKADLSGSESTADRFLDESEVEDLKGSFKHDPKNRRRRKRRRRDLE
jgi:hypothetical protein